MPPKGGIRLPGAHIDEATGVHPDAPIDDNSEQEAIG